jgi:hypothetical protein
MAITGGVLKQLIAQELETVADPHVQAHVRSLLVEPTPILRDWNYGKLGQQYACWAVLNHEPSGDGPRSDLRRTGMARSLETDRRSPLREI